MNAKPLISKQEHRTIKLLELVMRFPEQYQEFFTVGMNIPFVHIAT